MIIMSIALAEITVSESVASEVQVQITIKDSGVVIFVRLIAIW